MTTNQVERAAYLAAHLILNADLSSANLACPGAKRSHAIDSVADIIKAAFAFQSDAVEEGMMRAGARQLRQQPLRAVELSETARPLLGRTA